MEERESESANQRSNKRANEQTNKQTNKRFHYHIGDLFIRMVILEQRFLVEAHQEIRELSVGVVAAATDEAFEEIERERKCVLKAKAVDQHKMAQWSSTQQ